VQETGKLRPGIVPLEFSRMQAQDIDEVLRIEYAVYPFPWVRENFLDSLLSGYEAWIVRDGSRQLLGYFLMMVAVDEAHLLNITVALDAQGKGTGRLMLDKAVAVARERKMQSILLEVRPSNLRALSLYEHYGFFQIGVRKNYYPAAHGKREDAIVMRFPI
jgi:ribosomal-protein-alanine N-acetyltransferase